MPFLTKFFKDPNDKVVKDLTVIAEQINGLEDKISKLADNELKDKTKYFKEQLKSGKSLDDILPEVFAVVREAAVRTLSQRAFDTQLMSGVVLHRGQIAEQKTGEGKTLSAVLAAYLNALEEKGVHIVTVNDYLSKRDAAWMGQVYNFLGLSSGVIQHMAAFIYSEDKTDKKDDQERDETGSFKIEDEFLKPVSRAEAYEADITYGTNNEFGFDYLRDNMVQELEQKVQRPHNFAIIDEVDSILIDEARTPLIISAPAEGASQKYLQFASIVETLSKEEDYNIDEKMRAATLTEKGIAQVEKKLGVTNVYAESGVGTVHHIEQALKARALFKKDKDYVIKDGEIVIVDEFTGRLMFGRRFSEGLHQAIEAKENVDIKQESTTLASVTLQNLFRMFPKLSGMTGTAVTEAEEFGKIYALNTVVIPTNKDIQRDDKLDSIYASENGKFQALVKKIKAKHEKGQPVLVGTISIDKNERLGETLKREGVECNLLNAKNHEREAEIIAQAGQPGAVTVATNMAGRGVDIVLGGNPGSKEDREKVLASGGLAIIGTERHESRRIDNQLRGRSGRQGDVGDSQFMVSMDDDLMRVFGSDKMKNMMKTLRVPEDMPIENKIISRSIEKAQEKVEQRNFDTRKRLVEYDDVINKHREVVYDKRNDILKQAQKSSDKIKETVFEYIEKEIANVVSFHCSEESTTKWNLKEIAEVMSTIFPFNAQEQEQITKLGFCQADKMGSADCRTELIGHLNDVAKKKYEEIETQVADKELMRKIEKSLILRAIDTLWVEHLDQMTYLRQGIGLRGYAQVDPLIEYKKEAYNVFAQLMNSIQAQVVYAIYKVAIARAVANNTMNNNVIESAPAKTSENNNGQFGGFFQAGNSIDNSGKTEIQKHAEKSQQEQQQKTETAQPRDEQGNKIGRNDPCHCGSGKKFKKCHGA